MSAGRESADALARAYAHCAGLARERERDRWLSTLFAPEAARPALHALSAFAHEIARVRAAAREPLAGEMRLMWWREALAGEREAEAAGHPVAAALIDTRTRFALPAAAFDDWLQARRFDLTDDAMPTLADLETYCRRTASAPFHLAALILGEGRDLGAAEASGAAGLAAGLTEVLRTFAATSARGPVYLPRDMLQRRGASLADVRGSRDGAPLRAALSDLAAEARRRLEEAEALVVDLPTAVLPAFIPLGAARLDLARLRRARAPFDAFPAPSLWRRQWELWRWARGRRRRLTAR